jgi:diaminopimelate epimerase
MKHLLPVKITKMSGAGNTFVLIDARKNSKWLENEVKLKITRAEFSKMICDKVLGVGTDGALFLESGSSPVEYKWDFYNSDGSTAEMCGNAARCAARFCYEIFENQERSQFEFVTGAGSVHAQMLGSDKIRVHMPEAKLVKEDFEGMMLVNTGVPHLVKKIAHFSEAVAQKEFAKQMRRHAGLGQAGANVTFYSEETPTRIRAVSFERGVEDFTLACGTGAVAAAMVQMKRTGEHEIEVHMPGGMIVVVFNDNDPHPYMIGDAVFVGEFQYNLEVFR